MLPTPRRSFSSISFSSFLYKQVFLLFFFPSPLCIKIESHVH